MGNFLSADHDDTFRKIQESTQVLHKIKVCMFLIFNIIFSKGSFRYLKLNAAIVSLLVSSPGLLEWSGRHKVTSEFI